MRWVRQLDHQARGIFRSRVFWVGADAVCMARRFKQLSQSGDVRIRWMLFLGVMVIAGCSSVGTKIDNVWLDDARGSVALGKTLVLALTGHAEAVIVLENEWVRQLRDRGIDASPANLRLPGEIPPTEARVIAMLKAQNFDTLLVSRVVDVKQVERDVAAYQVAVVETKLYDTKIEQSFWSARADTYLVSPTGKRITALRSERAREFVGALIEEMSNSKLL